MFCSLSALRCFCTHTLTYTHVSALQLVSQFCYWCEHTLVWLLFFSYECVSLSVCAFFFFKNCTVNEAFIFTFLNLYSEHERIVHFLLRIRTHTHRLAHITYKLHVIMHKMRSLLLLTAKEIPFVTNQFRRNHFSSDIHRTHSHKHTFSTTFIHSHDFPWWSQHQYHPAFPTTKMCSVDGF